jgi:twitching motility two-component system response regulator PilH
LARRILLADDSVTAQNMGRRILTDAGYEVVTVNNGSAALKKIAENRPDIIVLDVYMPGYGGLEVCQRIKEASDTARIPVLLTVGKLEPFKPDEARRVGADAFIIKPFEATELLTALTRLEDKIVAGPQPQKSGRFAKALAAVERSDAGERFGDKETGWKNRLTIPSPNFKSTPAETDAPEVVAGPARDFDRSEAGSLAEAKPEFERPIPAGLPADITPEEIAAIAAAAASFDGSAGHPTVIPEGSASEAAASMQAASAQTLVQPAEPEAPAATLASATELENAVAPEVVAEAPPAAAETVSEPVATSEAAKVEDVAAASELPAATAETSSEQPAASPAEVTETPISGAQTPEAQTPETQVPEIEKPSTGDAEVMAAIASLAPSNGHGSESVVPASGSNGNGQEIPVAVALVAAAEAGITGPRWIAESVTPAPEELALMLEQEMEQISAARVAAEAAQHDVATATAVAVSTSAAVIEAATEPEMAPAVSVADAVATESVPAPTAENVPVESSVPQGAEQPVTKEESAYAAAASAGSGSEPAPTVEAISSAIVTVPSETSASASAATEEVAPQREAELAAAWQNWKQIRESFASPQPAAPVAEAPAGEAIAAQEEAAAPSKAADADSDAEVEAAPSDAPGESTAIASIVDTMLAELRPKLVEEIAKKMNSEKKEKEKEKDKKKKK